MKPLDYLIEWSSGANWKCFLLNEVITRKNLDVDILKEQVLDIIENDKEVELKIQQSFINEQEKDSNTLIIKSIRNPININAISEKSEFSLGKSLNVFYGENGTGKSSYVKIFRKLAQNYFTKEKHLVLHPNVYKNHNNTIEQTIEATYQIGQKQQTERVNINNANSVLQNINVFDADSVIPLLNEDLSFSILPQGFNYFDIVISYLDKLKSSVAQDISKLHEQKDKLFEDSSFQIVKNELEKIQKTVTYADLNSYINEHFPKSKTYNQDLEEVESRIKEITSMNTETTQKLLTAQREKLLSINKTMGLISSKINEENLAKVNGLIDSFSSKVVEEKEHNEKFQKQISYLETFNSEWLSFIKNGKLYYESIGKQIPNELDPCIFCSQLLDEYHVEKISNSFKHVSSTIIKEKESIQRDLLAQDIKGIKLELNSQDEELLGKEVLISKIKSVISLIKENMRLFSKGIMEYQIIEIPLIVNFGSIQEDIQKEVENINERLTSLNQTSIEMESLIAQLKERKEKLIKNELINTNIHWIKEWFEIVEKINSLTKVKRNFTTTAVTKKAKEAFDELVEENYLKTFKAFCTKLNVRDIEVKLKPQKGKTYRSKYISDEKYKITDIMSEGEQKAIAMAEFSTDLIIRKNNNTIIFDDPVTSLDYKRAESFANLIYNLSKEIQVVVFTHNIMFYYFLYNQCESDKNKENKFFKVDAFDSFNKGLVSETFSGRLDSLKDIKSRINTYSQKIYDIECMGDELEQNISLAYTEIRTWCELIVEEGFFKSIIRRYEPNIRFTKFSEVDGSFVEELQNVSDLFARSCRWMIGHSQPLETLHVKPDREDFFRDFEYIKKLTNKFTGVKWN